jgi:hypothetical protein
MVGWLLVDQSSDRVVSADFSERFFFWLRRSPLKSLDPEKNPSSPVEEDGASSFLGRVNFGFHVLEW